MSSILWEPPVVTNRLRFWPRQFALVPTSAQNRFDAIFGVILPVLCFITDPVVFKGTIGGPWLDDYQFVAYLISTIEMGLFLVWRTFRTRVNWVSPIFAGAFFAGAAFSTVIGLAILPLTAFGLIFVIGIFGFIPFITAFVYLRAGVRAMKSAGADVRLGTKISAAVFGAVLVTALPIYVNAQVQNEVSLSVQSVIHGDATRAEAAALQLKRMRVLPRRYRDQMSYAYGNEFDPVKRERIKRIYEEITGEDLAHRHPFFD